jgi:hypothetical protein
MASTFHCCVFKYIFHGVNVVAHSLALGGENSHRTVSCGISPHCIREMACHDITVV